MHLASTFLGTRETALAQVLCRGVVGESPFCPYALLLLQEIAGSCWRWPVLEEVFVPAVGWLKVFLGPVVCGAVNHCRSTDYSIGSSRSCGAGHCGDSSAAGVVPVRVPVSFLALNLEMRVAFVDFSGPTLLMASTASRAKPLRKVTSSG